jgi:HlyD family secretion protein
MKKAIFLIVIAAMLQSCNPSGDAPDASGTFETVETIVPAEVTGMLQSFTLEEGQALTAGMVVGYIDTIPLVLKKRQLEAQIKATGQRIPDVSRQTSYFNQQEAVVQSKLNHLYHEQKRIQNLVNADAATRKQLDDINAQIDKTRKQLQVVAQQKDAQESALQTQRAGLQGDALPLSVQVEQINDQLSRSLIVNKIKGTVIARYAEVNEMATAGKPLYKIADLSTLTLRAFVTGDQFSALKLNQKVTVLTDDGKGGYRTYEGKIEWISSKAEFTPKTIQTRDERANLVYAVKIRVKNDGYLKIGMYGEVKW